MFPKNLLSRSVLLFAIALMIAASAPAFSDTIAVIGTGRVGGALGPQFAALEHTVVYGSREPDRREVRELVSRTGPDASASSPRDAAEEADMILLAVPGLLVKEITRSLGDLSGKIVIDPTNPYAARTTDGNSEDAKAAVAQLAEGMGFEAIDVGPVQHARHIEGMLIIWINNRYVAGEPFEFHLRKVER